MNREHIISILYDIALVIGGEVSVPPLLTKTVQRILYHTSFPTGLVFLDLPPEDGKPLIQTQLHAAVGDFGINERIGQDMSLPAELLRGKTEVLEAPELLQALTGASRPYTVCLRMPIDHEGVILLLAPRQPTTQLPITQVFQPVMANLAKAIVLCRHNDAYTTGLLGERDEARQSHRESEQKFHSITSAAQDAIIMLNDVGHLAYWNPAAERIFGYQAEEILGQDIHKKLIPRRYYQTFNKSFQQFDQHGEGKIIEIEAIRKDGSEVPVELSVSALQLKDHWYSVGILRDITKRKQSERALQRANRTLKTLSGCNSILVRASNEVNLLQDICALIVDTGGYRSAWVAFVDNDSTSGLKAVASAGIDRDYVEGLDLSLDGPMHEQGPAVRAFRSGHLQLKQNFHSHDGTPTNNWNAVQRGIASSIALPLLEEGKPFGVLKVYADEREAFNDEEISLLQELAEDLSFGIAILRTRVERRRLAAAERENAARLQRALLGTIQAVALTVEKRDPYTAGHQQNVVRLAVAIAQEMDWPAEKVEAVRLGATIHDIGKIYIPAELLNRPGALTDLEYNVIKMHPQVGYDIVKDIEFPWPVAAIILQHHERLDGSGYPNHTTAEHIIPEARLLAVADVVEAMASHRPYRPAHGIEAALEEIQQYRGSRYDSEVVDACTRVFMNRQFRFTE